MMGTMPTIVNREIELSILTSSTGYTDVHNIIDNVMYYITLSRSKKNQIITEI